VNQESSIRFEPNNQILAAPLDGCDGLADQLGRGLHGVVRASEAGIRDLDVVERSSDEMRLEAGSNRLDLG
jgi:hypothetical protein